jgi:hypothetical protein
VQNIREVGNGTGKIAGPPSHSLDPQGKFRAMPRGRHRHSPPLHKLLPPIAVAAVAVACAGGAWFFAEPVVMRGLAAVAGAAALAGAVFMRRWDREAGRRVAALGRARESDQWLADERIAELESDVEEAREIRAKLDSRLRAKRVELARLRGEHAALLRRYATAETERASALEGRRRLAIEAAVEPRALGSGSSGTLSPSVYLIASRALDALDDNRRAQERARSAAVQVPAGGTAGAVAVRPGPEAQHAARAAGPGYGTPGAELVPEAAGAQDAGAPSLPVRTGAPSAIVPYARRSRPEQRSGSGFDFFGTHGGGHAAPAHGAHAGEGHTAEGGDAGHAPGAVDAADAANDAGARPAQGTESAAQDGGEQQAASAEQPAEGADAPGTPARHAGASAEETGAAPAAESGANQVIDLTEHDDAEPLEVGGLRSAIGS